MSAPISSQNNNAGSLVKKSSVMFFTNMPMIMLDPATEYTHTLFDLRNIFFVGQMDRSVTPNNNRNSAIPGMPICTPLLSIML